MQRTGVKTHRAASAQEARVNPSVGLAAALWSAAAESSTLQKKSVLSRFTHECVSVPTAVHYGPRTRAETLDGHGCWKSILQGDRTSVSHHNITHCTRTSGSDSINKNIISVNSAL